jgi:integrase
MKQPIASMFELYLGRSDLRPSSVRFKEKALDYFVEWFGDVPVGRVTPAMAEDYRAMLAKGRSKRSANGYLANFKPFFRWLQRHGRIQINPFDGVLPFRITELPRETFTPGELSRMLQISTRLWRVRVCMGLLGMRRGEMLNLRRDNIRLSARSPHILLCPSKATSSTWPWELKNKKIRYVALPERMSFDDIVVNLRSDVETLMRQPHPYLCLDAENYKKLMDLQRENMLRDTHVSNPTGNFQRSFRSLQRQAGVGPPRRFHELRAAFITKMIEKTDLSRAADAAGHSNVMTTKSYHRFSQMSLVEQMSHVASNCYETNVP